MEDPLKTLPRLDADAMAPCTICRRQLLETGLPLFFRLEAKQCGISMEDVRRHVGLAQAMGGGTAGLVLADVLGPGTKPVIVLQAPATFNVCNACATKHGLDLLFAIAVEHEPQKTKGDGA